MNLDQELDRLYGLSLAEFTRARDDLARELRKAGEAEVSAEVKTLSKPSLSAWTVNQLARQERLQVRSLLTAGERLREAQASLLRGGSPSELQEALERQRDVVGALLTSAKEILRAAGHPTTEATLERIRGTLTSAAGSDEGTQLVETGRLTKDLDPAGFGGLSLGTGTTSRPRTKGGTAKGERTPTPAKRRREEAEARKRRIEEAKLEVDALRAKVAEAKEHAGRAKNEARIAQRAAGTATEAAAKAERELERLTTRLAAAKDALERARSD